MKLPPPIIREDERNCIGLKPPRGYSIAYHDFMRGQVVYAWIGLHKLIHYWRRFEYWLIVNEWSDREKYEREIADIVRNDCFLERGDMKTRIVMKDHALIHCIEILQELEPDHPLKPTEQQIDNFILARDL